MTNVQPHVGMFMRYLGGGGAEIAMLNLGRGLTKQGIKVDLVLGEAWGPHIKKVPSEIQIVDLKASGTLQTLIALVHYLKQKQPVALISTLHYANELALWAKRLARVSTRVVVSEQNTLSQSIQKEVTVKRHLISLFVKYFYPWADSLVACSKGAAKDLAYNSGLPLSRIRAIYNPVVSPIFLEKAKESVAHSWFVPGEPPVILGVGKLEAQKDFPTLIRAFAHVRQTRPARLVILGWGPDQAQLEALVKNLGIEEDVALLGYVDNPYSYMAKAAVFVLSSAWEGFGNVLVEAMSVGTPVVSTDCKSGPAEILDDGKYGYLVPVGDSKAIAEAVLSILSGQTKSVDLGWLNQFSVETVTHQYCDVLEIAPT